MKAPFHYDDLHGAWCLRLRFLGQLDQGHRACAYAAAERGLDPLEAVRPR